MTPNPLPLTIRAYQKTRLLRARARRARPTWTGLRILGYHRITDERDELAVGPRRFREQMETVLDAGVKPIRLDAALDLLEEPIRERYVSVTFDDGYRDNLDNAVPVLRELGIPATIFVATAAIDGTATYDWYDTPPPLLSWDDVETLAREGLVDIQAHTRSHVWLPRLTDEEARDEVAGAKEDLERHVPHPVTSMCFPAGLYGQRERRLVQEAGYRAAVTCDPGFNTHDTPSETLRRTMVYGGDSAGDFAAKLAGAFDRPPLLRAAYYRYRATGGKRDLSGDVSAATAARVADHAVVMIADVDVSHFDATRTHTLEVARGFATEGLTVHLVTRGIDPRLKGVLFHSAGPVHARVLQRVAELNLRAVSLLGRRRRAARSAYVRHDWGLVPTLVVARVLSYRVVSQVDGLCWGPVYGRRREPGLRPWLAERARDWATAAMARLSADIVVPTEELKTQLVRQYAIEPRRVHVLPNGADIELFSPRDRTEAARRAGLDAELQYVVFVGLFAQWADFGTMLRAFARVAAANPRARLLLVGDGPQRSEIERLVAELRLAERVILTGMVERRSEVSDLVAAANVCLAAHRAPDVAASGASPTKLAEYFAAGRPVVAIDVPGVRAMLEESGAGIVVPADPEAMAVAIIELLDDPARAAALGAAGRRAAEERYSWRSIVRRTVPLLRDQDGTLTAAEKHSIDGS